MLTMQRNGSRIMIENWRMHHSPKKNRTSRIRVLSLKSLLLKHSQDGMVKVEFQIETKYMNKTLFQII